MTTTDCDVVIIGCGTVGATLANLLGKQGVSVKVLEREPGIYHAPRAGLAAGGRPSVTSNGL